MSLRHELNLIRVISILVFGALRLFGPWESRPEDIPIAMAALITLVAPRFPAPRDKAKPAGFEEIA